MRSISGPFRFQADTRRMESPLMHTRALNVLHDAGDKDTSPSQIALSTSISVPIISTDVDQNRNCRTPCPRMMIPNVIRKTSSSPKADDHVLAAEHVEMGGSTRVSQLPRCGESACSSVLTVRPRATLDAKPAPRSASKRSRSSAASMLSAGVPRIRTPLSTSAFVS